MSRPVLGPDDVARGRLHEAGTHVGPPVHGGQAVEAHADAAERASRSACDPGRPPRPMARGDERRGDRLARLDVDLLTVEADREPDGCGVGRHGTPDAAGTGSGDANRPGLNGARSRSDGRPITCWARRCAVAAARPIPAPSWPAAWSRPGARGSSPITGRWSGQ